jgi:hypothetical protein
MGSVIRRGLFLVVLLSGVLVPTRTDAAETIQPGDYMQTNVGACTLGFAATANSVTYFLTAAHCVDNVGQDVQLEDGTVFADVAVEGSNSDLPGTADDWALLTVRSAFASRVVGAVRGIPGSPSGIAQSNETAMLDVLRISGHGIPWFVDPITRENRYGVITYQDAEVYEAIGMDTNGDSGGPIVHQPSGQAFGLVSRLCLPLCTSEGPTIEGVFTKARARGYALTLKTN